MDLTGQDKKYLTFYLGNEFYGIEILDVQEIIEWKKTTCLPNMSDYMKGVINIRGAVVPIMDLRQMFKIGEAIYNNLTVVIIVKVETEKDGERMVGLVVDGVSDVEEISLENVQEPPANSGEALPKGAIEGIIGVQKKNKTPEGDLEADMVILLNVNLLITGSVVDEPVSE